ncbi:glycosyltransferase family 4 protein [Parvularcula sp. IMCC14364]|uniref:glycosyltransferase family 4 protein n=1 Tax=Parvularcula sp. IMCC14364 TaxID=3067902 RepID=UPI002741569C|nr:glycosyltransferase family 4 protein [Parvularcula sp. IMCC14364]
MKILFANRLFPDGFTSSSTTADGLGGIEIATQHIARELVLMGHEVSVAVNIQRTVKEQGITWQPACELQSCLSEDHGLDAIISSNDSMPFVWRGNSNRALCFLWQHNPMPLVKAWRKKQLSPILKTKPHLVCVGSYLKKSFSSLYPFASRAVIGLGVSDIFKHDPVGYIPRRAIWLSQSQRGLKETLTLWMEKIAPNVPDSEMLVFSCQHREKEYDPDALKRAGIKFMPRISQEKLAHYLNRSRIMIYPGARDETFCLAAAEALCSGVPVVTRGIGSLSERVRHGVDGLILQSDQETAEAGIRILSDDAYWRNLRDGALAARDQLSWSSVAQEWVSHIDALKRQ